MRCSELGDALTIAPHENTTHVSEVSGHRAVVVRKGKVGVDDAERHQRRAMLVIALVLLVLTLLVFTGLLFKFQADESITAKDVTVVVSLVGLCSFFCYAAVGVPLDSDGIHRGYGFRNRRALTAEDLLHRYKAILSAILPTNFLGSDGLLQPPAGHSIGDRGSESIKIIPPAHKPKFQVLKEVLFGSKPFRIPNGAYYRGGMHLKLLRHHIRRTQSLLPENEHYALLKYVQQEIAALPQCDIIDLSGQMRPGSLAHEAFHDVQSHLLDYFPDLFDELLVAIATSKESVVRWYGDATTARWRTPVDYQLTHIFPQHANDVPYNNDWLFTVFDAVKQDTGRTVMSKSFWEHLYVEFIKDFGRAEAIPVLLAAAAERNNQAAEILSPVFAAVGFHADFYYKMPLLE